MDAFNRFWQWANKPPESPLTIPAELHRAVMELAPENRPDLPTALRNVRSQGQSGKHLLGLSFSGSDPISDIDPQSCYVTIRFPQYGGPS